jgi:hypothetical protein
LREGLENYLLQAGFEPGSSWSLMITDMSHQCPAGEEIWWGQGLCHCYYHALGSLNRAGKAIWTVPPQGRCREELPTGIQIHTKELWKLVILFHDMWNNLNLFIVFLALSYFYHSQYMQIIGKPQCFYSFISKKREDL